MATEIFDKINAIIGEIESARPASMEELETFRIKYLGSKNVLKPLSGEIRNIPNERKKDFGLLINKAKQTAEHETITADPLINLLRDPDNAWQP